MRIFLDRPPSPNYQYLGVALDEIEKMNLFNLDLDIHNHHFDGFIYLSEKTSSKWHSLNQIISTASSKGPQGDYLFTIITQLSQGFEKISDKKKWIEFSTNDAFFRGESASFIYLPLIDDNSFELRGLDTFLTPFDDLSLLKQSNSRCIYQYKLKLILLLLIRRDKYFSERIPDSLKNLIDGDNLYSSLRDMWKFSVSAEQRQFHPAINKRVKNIISKWWNNYQFSSDKLPTLTEFFEGFMDMKALTDMMTSNEPLTQCPKWEEWNTEITNVLFKGYNDCTKSEYQVYIDGLSSEWNGCNIGYYLRWDPGAPVLENKHSFDLKEGIEASGGKIRVKKTEFRVSKF